jgi:hypothetical protein
MQNIRQALQQRSSQPLLFAAHFDITAYPFYWLNDKKYNTLNWVSLYQNTITEADRQLGIFLQLLQEQGLLEHAVFILLSDHGITFKLPNDRIVNEAFYQGDKSKIVLDRQKYSSLEMHFADDLVKNPPLDTKVIYLKQKELDTEINESKFKGLNESIPLNEKSGIDASFGYGTDILSFAIQNHPLLAFKTYGVNLGSPHTVKGRAMLLDIMPTLLDILHLPPLTETDGISLKPYLQSANLAIPKQRPIFLESCYSIDEIQKENILVGDVLKTNITYFNVNPQNKMLDMTTAAENAIISHKQRGILQGDWFLAYYPASQRYKSVLDQAHRPHLVRYTAQPFAMLINVKTRHWTMDLNNTFSQQAPLQQLTHEMHEYFGAEMKNYAINKV